MRYSFLIATLCIFSLVVFSQKIIVKYDYSNEKGQLIINQVSLYKKNRLYTFCFATSLVESFKDSIINGQRVPVVKLNEQDNPCGFRYGDYLYTKRGNFIYLNIYDPISRKLMNHKQYSLIKGDSTSYATIFAGPHVKFPIQDGYASFQGDTTISSSTGVKYLCYVFLETTGTSYDNKYPITRKMFLDKKTLLPVRYEYYRSHPYSVTYYLLREINKRWLTVSK